MKNFLSRLFKSNSGDSTTAAEAATSREPGKVASNVEVVQPIETFGTNDFTMPDYCMMCKHFDSKHRKCAAFPNGIPVVIYFGKVDHRKPFQGDGGITFEGNMNGAGEMVDTALEWRKKNPRN